MDEKPELSQLFICEKLIFEQGSSNVSLINCFHTRLVEDFETESSPFVVYGVLTGGHGVFTIHLQITHCESDDDIAEYDMPMLFTDRLKRSNLIWRVNELQFPDAGRYEVCASIDGDLLAMATFTVRKRV